MPRTCATRTLLPIHLCASTTNFSSRPGPDRTLTPIRVIHDASIMNQLLRKLCREPNVVNFDFASHRQISIQLRYLSHQAAPKHSRYVLTTEKHRNTADYNSTGRRMETKPPFGPGTAPLTASTPCSTSYRTTRRFRTVALALP